MINLARHIEVLLLKHDCVVVPGFGGFVAQYVPARYVPEELSLMPPHRTVSFNAQLTWDDGLLVQSCMQTADCSYPEAVRLVKKAVDELKRRLTDEGACAFDGIGQLTVRAGGLYEFIPAEAGVASPVLYGLEPVRTATIHASTSQQVPSELVAGDSVLGALTSDDDDAQTRPKRSYTLSLNRELCNYVAAAVVAMVFYFLWVTPIGTTVAPSEGAVASMLPTPQKLSTPQAAKPSPASTRAAKTPTSEKTTETKERVLKDETPYIYRYTIILVSSVKKSNAEAYVAALHKEGLTEAEVLVRPRMVRVSYGHYSTENEAYDTLRKLRSDKRFADAWVMRISD